MKAPITVILPTYERAHFLKRAILSVLSQTYPHFQLCVYDNGSDFETEVMMNDYAAKDSRILYERHPVNIGMTENYKYGYSKLTTPYFCFLSDDDYYEPWFLETALQDLERHPDAAFSACNVQIIDSENRFLFCSHSSWGKTGYLPQEQGFFEMIGSKCNFFSPTCILFNKKVLIDCPPNWNAKISLFWDPEYLTRITARFPIFMNQKVCGYFLAHEGGFSSGIYDRLRNSSEEAQMFFKSAQELLKTISNNSEFSIMQRRIVKRSFTQFFAGLAKHFFNAYRNKKKHMDCLYLVGLLFRYFFIDRHFLYMFFGYRKI